MRARTRTEKEVIKLSRRLGDISHRDERILLANTYGNCKYEDMYDRACAVISQGRGDWQVLRYVRIDRHRNIHREVSYSLWEVMQIWLCQGKEVLISRQRTMGYYIDTFAYDSRLEIRKRSRYGADITALPYSYVYHKSWSSQTRYVRSQLKTIDGYTLDMLRFLLTNPVAESIIKRDPELAKELIINRATANDAVLGACKISLRHGYDIKTEMGVSNYIDYIKAIDTLGLDWHNPHYACPSDAMQAHDRYIHRLDAWRNEQERKARAKSLKEDNDRYVGWRKRFFPMDITDGTIHCRVLQSVEEFYDEGQAQHNCVYAMEYYKKPYSLVMSARIGGKRIETIEVNLTNYRILQCYGACNKFSIYHQRILDLVTSQMQTIKAYNKKQDTDVKQLAI